MKCMPAKIILPMTIVVAIAFASATHADDTTKQGASPESQAQAQTQAQAQSQANSEAERQRQQAEQDARKSLDQDAIAAIEETQNALKAVTSGRSDEALAAIERATGKKISTILQLRLHAAAQALKKKIDAAEQSIELVPRLANRFADFQCQRARERRMHVGDAGAECANRVQTFF